MSSGSTRYYALDALRAFLLLSGVIFHLAIPYTGINGDGNFVSSDTSRALCALSIILHYFRMPAFFLLSGFFSALIWHRKGWRGFLLNRLKRIGVVWLIALALMWPVVSAISVYNHFASQRSDPLPRAWNSIVTHQVKPQWLHHAQLHLWFLEYLLMFCVAAAVIVPMLDSILPQVDYWFGILIRSSWRSFLLAIPTAASLCQVPFGIMPYPASFLPWFVVLFGYGWFYTVGWMLHRRRDLLPLLVIGTPTDQWAIPSSVVVTLFLMKEKVAASVEAASAPWIDIAMAYSIGVFIWSIILLLVARFDRIRPSQSLLYISDSSYWIYLTHFAPALLIPALLRDWQAPPVVKVGLSTVVLSFTLFWIYGRFIRYSALGRALHGARSRGQPAAQAMAMR